MYTLKSILSGLCLFFSISLTAQKKDSDTGLPYSNKTEINNQVLESLFQSDGKISMDLATGLRLEGTLQNKLNYGDSIISILIRVENRPGSLLSLTRYKDTNGHVSYSGNLMRLHDSESLILSEKDRRYFFIETQQKYLVTE
jgi:hypothetical protein